MKEKRLKLQGRLILHMQAPNYSPSNQDRLARELNLPSQEHNQLKRTLRSMHRKGIAAKSKGGRWQLQRLHDKLIECRLSVTRSGFGICTPLESEDRDEEFFVARRCLNGAIDGDIVMVALRPPLPHIKRARRDESPDRLRRAEVAAIEAHGKPRVTGVLVKTQVGYVLRPDSPGIDRDITVESIELPGRGHRELLDHKLVLRLSAPHGAVGPAAKLTGVVIEDLGHKDAPGVDVLSIASQYDISSVFAEPIEQAAVDLSKAVSAKDLQDRRDLRKLLTVTIDPENARDFDDAVSIARHQNGEWELYVHIADVPHYVPQDSPIDIEASARGNSTYLVDRVMPMLPEHLTNDVCSLRPEVDSLTHTARIVFNPQGEVIESETFRSVIHSDARLIYEQVQAFFDGRRDHRISERICTDLALMRKLALILRRKRVAEGSLDFSMPEVRCMLDDSGDCVDIVKQGGSEACRVVEEFMLAANRVVARKIHDSGWPSIYRIHPEPDEDEWGELLAELKVLGVDPLPHKFSDINDALAAMADSGGAHAFSVRILRTMKKASYSADSTSHFGLGFDFYTHFTSPIRRYPDLIVHRILSRLEEGAAEDGYAVGDLKRIARHCSDTEVQSMYAERESVDLKRIDYFKKMLGRGVNGPFSGVVVSIIPKGLLVELDDTLQSGLVPFSTMRDDHYEVDKNGLVARGRRSRKIWKVGDALSVRLARVDEQRKQVDFEI